MKKTTLPYLAILIVVFYGIYNAMHNHTTKPQAQTKRMQSRMPQTKASEHILRQELSRVDTVAYTYRYVLDVIEHGSNQLHFKPQEVMEGGFVGHEDAPKVACYVLSLAGESCPLSSAKDAAMFYSSNCAGCHGEDGKGLHGTYPDLTRRPLLGIEARKTLLERMLRQ